MIVILVEQCGQHGVRVIQCGKRRMRTMRHQVIDTVAPSSHANRAHAQRSTTMNISGRITDNHKVMSDEVESENFTRATLRNCRQRGAIFMITTKCTHTESCEVDTHSAQFVPRPVLNVAR